MNLKAQLTFYLREKGMTAAELSRKAGVPKQTLSLWLDGAEPRKMDQLKKVAGVLATTVDNLLFGNGVDQNQERVTELDALLGDGWLSGIFEVRLRRIKKKN